ncbi:aldehyde dehydrogenase family protein [Halalkalibacterium halodurans]|uniref:3-sulfolactaldehyde dehydrogenase n=1 Tax=Halalkalibacterium halodurans (strain ATCC BAA-125 / DSM 18197 / FERM 7344 / JCM 9153 / C-125) TaxID=272558 RepID=Q9KBB8_HALH5|nr:aldehyde dehydrogenase family protein [Halalkalibacterium halodurans]MDY7222569.1 aldehyde dehydrogenase family protein [Halalkalibacterium halodurans]MDY7241790.1 aldehyde dehydrogenase family protein [Halalkalibacterium halodurans]BAB05729.1 aldehyde dehydrogenase [Halalkalibacterium halodurans C-125]
MEAIYTRQFLAGEWIEGASTQTITNYNPYTGEKIHEIKGASLDDLDQAYRAAKNAQKEWEQTLPAQKQEVLEKAAALLAERKDEVIERLVNEAGSSIIKASIEWGATLQTIKVAATFPLRMEGKILPSNIPGKENRIYRSAKGVIGVISPFNFPLVLAMRSVAPALATGNAVVLKCSSDAPITSGLLIAELFEEAGLPKGVLNVVVGKAAEIGDAFVTHPIPKLISFTGSTEVGRHIAQLAARELKETALELGGNNVMIVLDDADIEKAAEKAAVGKFLHQGQICMALNRIIVDASIYDSFVEVFKEKVSQLQTGNPAEPATLIGPLINYKQIGRIQQLVKESVAQGAVKVLEGHVQGNLMSPTILSEVTNDMPVAKEEIFGPIAPIIKAKDEAEAIAIANDSPYGLSGSIFTGSLHRGVQVAKQIDTGMIHVNDQPVNEEAHISFGGEKDSGIGRFGGEWVLDKFTTVKWISIQEKERVYPFWG